ncbi:FecR family protein [Sphingobacterium griseoflavum]|uniref:Iron dicitrate transporter FecR n=1 Tax=Sphingobacterium griseoflavum TaxID=1474952 RepID=A0ABQ3I1D6_9SPHI|nr:FecR family protein [Sphingobacterium griseoflavum]GHE44722.1 iron dicitrate transporter FecR [Sphingobacterium griseoflavum]
MNRKKDNHILENYRLGRCSKEELNQLETWYDSWNRANRISLTEEELQRVESKMRLNVMKRVGFDRTARKWGRIHAISAVAAALVITIGVAIYHSILQPQTGEIAASANYGSDIAPGKNKATLTLPGGEVVTLIGEKNAVVVDKNELIYPDGTDIATATSQQAYGTTSIPMHTIVTPRGGQYQLILSDKTKIWLNASSSVRFPTSFTGAKQRRIEISGEAYLEVTKDTEHPFLVKTGTQEIEVLGTRFNVSDYTDDAVAQTTLLEGSVSVKPLYSTMAQNLPKILEPGQEVLISNRKVTVRSANIKQTLAWKNGDFRFEDESVPAIMKQIERWYDVDVVYTDNLSEVKLNASISRYRNVSQMLKMMEKTGEVHFKIEGRKIIVSK